MSDPLSASGAAGASLVAIASAVVGSKFGPFATVMVAALIGTLVSLGEVETTSRTEAAKYVARYVSMAAILSGTLAYLIERYFEIPAVELLALVAFLIGWVGNRWLALREAIAGALGAFIGRAGTGGKGAGQ